QVTCVSRKIGRRNYGAHTGHRACLAGVDTHDLCVRMGRAQDKAFQQSVRLQITGVEERARGTRVPIDDAATLSDVFHARPVSAASDRVASATERIASTIPV